MPIRLVAMDLDGTLLNSQSEISPANRAALVAASERGVQLVVVTGRRFHSALPIVQQIPCPVTLISSNGAMISNSSGQVIHRNFLPHQIGRKALELAREYRLYAVGIW
jgi:HAD superfamily hydrolase (TIGR01484 family)